MTLEERSGKRDLVYSGWHRPSRIKRFLDPRKAARLGMIDIDACEYCAACKAALALIEVKHHKAPVKTATVTLGLGQDANVPVFLVCYVPDESAEDIKAFQWKQLWPPPQPPARDLTLREYAEWLWSLRESHECKVSA